MFTTQRWIFIYELRRTGELVLCQLTILPQEPPRLPRARDKLPKVFKFTQKNRMLILWHLQYTCTFNFRICYALYCTTANFCGQPTTAQYDGPKRGQHGGPQGGHHWWPFSGWMCIPFVGHWWLPAVGPMWQTYWLSSGPICGVANLVWQLAVYTVNFGRHRLGYCVRPVFTGNSLLVTDVTS